MSEMPNKKPEKKETGKVNYVWVLAGGYLVYLAVQIFKVLLSGESDQPVIGIIGGVAFAIIGALLMYREWKHYKYGQEHIDDPSTWSDEEEELPETADEEEEAVEELTDAADEEPLEEEDA